MNREGSNGSCYYSILGIRRGASSSEIRSAYRKLALKWHPDRWASKPKVTGAGGGGGEAKRRFQQIQEAYSVLSDGGKRSMYDAGLYDPFEEEEEEEEEEEGFSDFMQEMLSMMNNVRPGEESFGDLQKMFVEMASGSGSGINGGGGGGGGDSNRSATGKKGTRERGASQGNAAKRRVNVPVSVSD